MKEEEHDHDEVLHQFLKSEIIVYISIVAILLVFEILSLMYFGLQTYRYSKNYKHLSEPYTLATLIILGFGIFLKNADSVTFLILLINMAMTIF